MMDRIPVHSQHLGPYMTLRRFQRRPGRKTDEWDIVNRGSGIVLAHIKWDCAWRRYVFIPVAHNSIWAVDCLRLIGDFIERQMAARARGAE